MEFDGVQLISRFHVKFCVRSLKISWEMRYLLFVMLEILYEIYQIPRNPSLFKVFSNQLLIEYT